MGVIHPVWDARLTAESAFTGMAFLQTDSGVRWAKAAHVSRGASVRVSFHAHAESNDERKTFAVSFDDAFLPSVPVVANSDPLGECLVDTPIIFACLARCDGNAFFVVLFAGGSVEFGRNRLWRLRDSMASQLPPDIRERLTRRRAGVLRPVPMP
jgi:hypothetical protein